MIHSYHHPFSQSRTWGAVWFSAGRNALGLGAVQRGIKWLSLLLLSLLAMASNSFANWPAPDRVAVSGGEAVNLAAATWQSGPTGFESATSPRDLYLTGTGPSGSNYKMWFKAGHFLLSFTVELKDGSGNPIQDGSGNNIVEQHACRGDYDYTAKSFSITQDDCYIGTEDGGSPYSASPQYAVSGFAAGFSWLVSTTPFTSWPNGDTFPQYVTDGTGVYKLVGNDGYGSNIYLSLTGYEHMSVGQGLFDSYYHGLVPGSGLAGVSRLHACDVNGNTVATGSAGSGAPSIWVNGTRYYFQASYNPGAWGGDYYSNSAGGLLYAGLQGPGALYVWGDDNHGNVFSGGLYISFSSSDPNLNKYAFLQTTSGTYLLGYAGESDPTPQTSVPEGAVPAIYVTVNGAPVFWPFLTSTPNGTLYYTSPDYLQNTSGNGAWLSLLQAGSSSYGTLAGLPAADSTTTVLMDHGVFVDSPVPMRTALSVGHPLSLVGLPDNAPPALWVNGETWFLNILDATLDPNRYVYQGPKSGSFVTVRVPANGSVWDGTFNWQVYDSSTSSTHTASGLFWSPDSPYNQSSVSFVVGPDSLASYGWLDIRPAQFSVAWTPPASSPEYGPASLIIDSIPFSFQRTFTYEDVSSHIGTGVDIYVNHADLTQVVWVRADGSLVEPTDLGTTLAIFRSGVILDPLAGHSIQAVGAALYPPLSGHPGYVTINGHRWQRSNLSDGSTQDVYVGAGSGQQLVIDADNNVVYNNPQTGVSNLYGQFNGTDFTFLRGLPTGETMVADTNTTGDSGIGSAGAITELQSLDILGNILSLGQWQNNANVAGFTLQFSDAAPTEALPNGASTVAFVQSRQNAGWLWEHATTTPNHVAPSMNLDSANRLSLFDPAAVGSNLQPTLVLDPSGEGVSQLGKASVDVMILNQASGGISMGVFTSSGGN